MDVFLNSNRHFEDYDVWELFQPYCMASGLNNCSPNILHKTMDVVSKHTISVDCSFFSMGNDMNILKFNDNWTFYTNIPKSDSISYGMFNSSGYCVSNTWTPPLYNSTFLYEIGKIATELTSNEIAKRFYDFCHAHHWDPATVINPLKVNMTAADVDSSKNCFRTLHGGSQVRDSHFTSTCGNMDIKKSDEMLFSSVNPFFSIKAEEGNRMAIHYMSVDDYSPYCSLYAPFDEIVEEKTSTSVIALFIIAGLAVFFFALIAWSILLRKWRTNNSEEMRIVRMSQNRNQNSDDNGDLIMNNNLEEKDSTNISTHVPLLANRVVRTERDNRGI